MSIDFSCDIEAANRVIDDTYNIGYENGQEDSLTKEQRLAIAILREKVLIRENEDGPWTIEFPSEKTFYGGQKVLAIIDKGLAAALQMIKTIKI